MALDLEKIHTTHSKIERIPEDTYMGRICAVVDLGIQPQTDWKTGEPSKSKPRVLLSYELPTETIEIEHHDGEKEELPRLISKEYTLSKDDRAGLMKLKKALKPDMTAVDQLLTLPCMVSVGSTVNGKAKVTDVMKVPGQLPVPELTIEPLAFDFDEPSEEVFRALPEWIQTKIKEAENYSGFADGWTDDADEEEGEVEDDDIPF